MSEMPLAPIERLMRIAGAERVSEESAIEMRKELEKYGKRICERAIVFAEHANRKTIKASDIHLAISEMKDRF